MKSRNKKHLVITFIVILLLILLTTTFASSEGFYDSSKSTDPDSYQNLHENYYLDMEDVSFFKDPLAIMFHAIANIIFGGIKVLGLIATAIVKFSLSTDLFKVVGDFINPLFSGLNNYIFKGLSIFFISIAGFMFALKLVKRQISAIGAGIMSLLLVIVIANIFFTKPLAILENVNEVGNQISGDLLRAPYEATLKESSGNLKPEELSSELLWNILVHTPWQLLEFDDTKTAVKYEDKILKVSPGTDERKEAIEKISEKEEVFKANSAREIGRITTALVLFIFNLFIFMVVVMFCILILGYQAYAIILSLLGIFVIMLSLIPSFGLRVLWNWMSKIGAAILIKALLFFLLAIIFTIMDFVYSLSDTYGLLTSLFVIIAIVAILYLKKNAILDLFSKPIGSLASEINDMGSSSFNPVGSLREGAGNIRNLRLTRNHTYTEGNRGYSDDYEADIEPENRYSDIALRRASYVDESSQSESLPTSSQREAGLELLRRNYELSREKSENYASSTGEDVEYTPFVKRTMALRELNPDAEFDNRDVEMAARVVKRTEDMGGSVESLYREPEITVERSKPMSFSEHIPVSPAYEEFREDEASGSQDRDKSAIHDLRGIDYFRASFGEEKGEEFYNRLSDKYGEERVRNYSYEAQEGEKVTFSKVQRDLKEAPDEISVLSDPPIKEKVEEHTEDPKPVTRVREKRGDES